MNMSVLLSIVSTAQASCGWTSFPLARVHLVLLHKTLVTHGMLSHALDQAPAVGFRLESLSDNICNICKIS